MNILEKCEVLGLRLKAARLDENLTQSELSKIAGISRGKIVEAEKGFATVETVFSILSVLRKEQDLDLLLSGMPTTASAKLKRSNRLRKRASGSNGYLLGTEEQGSERLDDVDNLNL